MFFWMPAKSTVRASSAASGELSSSAGGWTPGGGQECGVQRTGGIAAYDRERQRRAGRQHCGNRAQDTDLIRSAGAATRQDQGNRTAG
jgi:hypothetical protein